MTDHELTVAIQEAQLACLRGRRGAYDLVQMLEGFQDWKDAEMTWPQASDRIGELENEKELLEERVEELEDQINEKELVAEKAAAK